MRAELDGAIRAAAERVIATARVPGLVVAVARGGRPVASLALGTDAAGEPLAVDSLLPVASITKLATALAVLRLVDVGALALDAPLARHQPEAAAAHEGVTLRMLLSHTSGLPLDLPREQAPPYAGGLDWPALAAACIRTPLEAPPLTRVQYSNVGYGLLALMVERWTGQGFARALGALVLEPLGLEAYFGVEPPRPVAVLADVRGRHVGTALEPFNSTFWQALGLPWGGLVTSAPGALALLAAFQGTPTDFLTPTTRAEATRNQARELGGGQVEPLIWERCPWGLGPELRDAKHPHWAPTEAGPDSYGHAGASGAVAWADPASSLAWAIVGTRTATSGWLLRGGPALGAAILEAAQ